MECWHIFFCPEKANPTYAPSDNAVNVINEVKVDNNDSEFLLSIIAIIQIIMLGAIILQHYKKTLKKRYSARSIPTTAATVSSTL